MTPNTPLLELAGVLSVLVATGVAYWQLTLLRRQQANEVLRLRRGRALEYSITRAPHLRELRSKIDSVFPPEAWARKAVPQDELKTAFSRDETLRPALHALLAHWENLGLTVAADVTDEDMAFDMVGGVLVGYVARFGIFIDARTAENDRLYCYLIRLARRWEARLEAHPSRTIFED